MYRELPVSGGQTDYLYLWGMEGWESDSEGYTGKNGPG